MNTLDFALKLSEAAIDLDRYIRRADHDLGNIKEIANLLEKYQLKDADKSFTRNFTSFYEPLWNAMKKDSCKELRYVSEIALEMRLLRSELENIPNNHKRLEELSSFLCCLSSEFLKAENYQRRQYRMVA